MSLHHRHLCRAAVACFAALLLVPSLASAADEWGTLKGRFVFAGDKVPDPEPIKVDKDADVCKPGEEPVDEELLVDKPTRGIANVIVILREKKDAKLAIHPAEAAKAAKPLVVDNKKLRFEPHIAVGQAGQKIEFKNSDPVGHNTKGNCRNNEEFNQLIPPKDSFTKDFPAAELVPFSVSCNIHPWMKAHVLVLKHPYAVVSAKDGSFELKNVPVGEHEFQVWHEKVGYLKGVEFGGQKIEQDKKYRVSIKVAAGTKDLGEVKVLPEQLKK